MFTCCCRRSLSSLLNHSHYTSYFPTFGASSSRITLEEKEKEQSHRHRRRRIPRPTATHPVVPNRTFVTSTYKGKEKEAYPDQPLSAAPHSSKVKTPLQIFIQTKAKPRSVSWKGLISEAQQVKNDFALNDVLRALPKDEASRVIWDGELDLARVRPDVLVEILRTVRMDELEKEEWGYVVQGISMRVEPNEKVAKALLPRVMNEIRGNHFLGFTLLFYALRTSETLGLGLFKALWEAGWMPVECVHQTENAMETMGVTATRACLFWGFRALAVRFSGISPKEEVIRDAVYATLDNAPTRGQFRAVAEVGVDLGEEVVRRIMTVGKESAGRLMKGQRDTYRVDCLGVYAREGVLVGNVVLWLLQGAVQDNVRDSSGIQGASQGTLARRIVEDVAGNPAIHVPVEDREELIALAAMQGFARPARMLYDRYTQGKGADLVKGSGRVLTRMVALFERLRQEKEDSDNDLGVFVQHVLDSFIEVNTQLTHENITSLARAYFILGRVDDGFNAFKQLIVQNITPDMHDLNTALTVLAEHSPERALKIVEQMDIKGITPDTVTIGILLNAAFSHNNIALATQILDVYRHVGFDQKNLDAYVRGYIASGGDILRCVRLLASQPTGIPRNISLAKWLVYQALARDQYHVGRRVWQVLLKGAAEQDDLEQMIIRKKLKITN